MTNDLTLQGAFDEDLFDFVDGGDTTAGALLREMEQMNQKPSPEDVAFRQCSPHGRENIQWTGRNSKTPELLGENILAVRGVLVKSRFGFFLYDQELGKPVCSTISMCPTRASSVDQSPDEDGEIRDRLPMPIPFYSPFNYGDKTTPHPDVERLGLMGSRGKTCAECVQSGEAIIPSTNGTSAPSACGMNAGVVFCVTQVGIGKANNVTSKWEIEWVNAVDYRNNAGEQVWQTPFCITLRLSKSTTNYSIGDKMPAIRQPNSYTPADVLTYKDYIETLTSNHAYKEDTKFGVVWLAVTEMYASEKAPQSLNAAIRSIPTFRTVTDPKVIGAKGIGPWVSSAWHTYQNEKGVVSTSYKAVAGKPEGSPAVTAAAPTTTAAPTAAPTTAPTTTAAPTTAPKVATVDTAEDSGFPSLSLFSRPKNDAKKEEKELKAEDLPM